MPISLPAGPANPGGFTYDLTTPLGQARLLAFDNDAAHMRFGDGEWAAFLALNDQVPKLAAASALDATAVNQVMVLKVIRQLDLSTDGAAVARTLQALAAELRRQVEEQDGALFDIAEVVYDDFTYRQRILNQWLREGP